MKGSLIVAGTGIKMVGHVTIARHARSSRDRRRSYTWSRIQDADPDIPILRQAKAEYAKLH